MIPLLLLLTGLPQKQQNVQQNIAVQSEIQRLGACHPVFKLSPPPVHMRVVWTQPFDLAASSEGKDKVRIEFSIQYAQSANFATADEAAKTQEFAPDFNLRQRNHYAVEGDHLRLLWRESYIDSQWKPQAQSQPEFACWQTIPAKN